MDRKKGLLNVIISIVFKIFLLIGAIIARRFLIQYAGEEATGLDSLYVSIIGFLSVAELGVGSAITFCMYKPIVEGNNNKVSALYHLFVKLYWIIGGIILVVGCMIMPCLKYLAGGSAQINQNLYLTFSLTLISVVISYMFSAKISLINAYKNNYISTSITSSGQLLQYGLQIVVLCVTHSFIWYLVCKIVAVLFQWGVAELVSRKKYNEIIKNKQKIDAETKNEITKNVKAVFMHKIGGVLVNSADSIIISAFISAFILGRYTNYTTIVVSMTGVIGLFFTPLTSIIGHLCVQENKAVVSKYLNFFHTFNFIIGIVFFLGYYAIIDNLVTLCYGGKGCLELSKWVSFIITLNYFIQFMRQATLLFRDATGTFYYDRWKPLFEGLINIGLSIGFVYLFGYLFGEEFAVVGVIAATILTNLFICHIVEPYVLYRYCLNDALAKYYIRNYLYIFVFIICLVALHFSMRSYVDEWIELLVNGSISVAIASVPIIVAMLADKDFRHYFKRILSRFSKKKEFVALDSENVEK